MHSNWRLSIVYTRVKCTVKINLATETQHIKLDPFVFKKKEFESFFFHVEVLDLHTSRLKLNKSTTRFCSWRKHLSLDFFSFLVFEKKQTHNFKFWFKASSLWQWELFPIKHCFWQYQQQFLHRARLLLSANVQQKQM